MKTKVDKTPYFDRGGVAREVLAPLIAGIAIILFSTAVIARMLGLGLRSTEDSGDGPALDLAVPVSAAGEVRARPRCPECGVIMSMREINEHDEDSGPGAASGATAGSRDETRVKSARSYEIIVRMADGSSRVIEDAIPARWRTGERLMIIAGTDPSRP